LRGNDDFPAHSPRFQGENFQRNLALVKQIEEIAAKKGCTPAQLAIAWLLAQGQEIIPIPGTKKRDRLRENAQAVEIELSSEDRERIEQVMPLGAAMGTRYPEAIMDTLNQ
jgi:aryl-alcohol dehydrogenase-like predicted oxidoreductase